MADVELDHLEEQAPRDHTILGSLSASHYHSSNIRHRVGLAILESPTELGTLAAVAIGWVDM